MTDFALGLLIAVLFLACAARNVLEGLEMSNLPDDTTPGTVDRAAWDAEEDLRDWLEGYVREWGDPIVLPSPVAFGPLDVAAMQAVLDRLKATLTDDDRAAVSAVITVEEPR